MLAFPHNALAIGRAVGRLPACEKEPIRGSVALQFFRSHMTVRSPEIGALEGDEIRPLQDVLNRTLTLGATVSGAVGTPCDELLAWLAEMNLLNELTAKERMLLNEEASDQLVVDFSWQSERLVVLLWALNKIDALPFPAPNASVAFIAELLPPGGEELAAQFCASARLRSEDELFAAAHEIQELHAIARQRRFSRPDYRPGVPELDGEVIQERHHAINWLVGYCGQSWDEITTDT